MTTDKLTPGSVIVCPSGAGAYTGREAEYVWRFNTDTKEWIAPQRQQAYIDWFLTPKFERVPKTFADWCRLHGVNQQTVYRWRKEQRFKEAMKKSAEEKNYSTEQIQAVIDAVWQNAVNGDTKAAALYLQVVKEIMPVTKVIVEDVKLQDLSNEQLIALLEEQIDNLRQG